MKHIGLFYLLSVFLTAQSSLAAPVKTEHVEAELICEVPWVRPGEPFWVALRLKCEEGWHTYWKDPGDSGMATRITWQLPQGFHAGGIQWPQPEKIVVSPLTSYGYHGEVFLLTEITPPPTLRPTTTAAIRARADWLVCREICLPGQADLEITLPVAREEPPQDPRWIRNFQQARLTLGLGPEEGGAVKGSLSSIGVALLFSFLGGLVLNLMPCVLPVLSIKILGFVQQAQDTHTRPWKHGVVFSVGVISSFCALAGMLLLFRAWGHEWGWGFQLQSPLFVVVLSALFFMMGLNLLGVFEVGTALIGLGSKSVSGYAGSFLSGTLATVVATPCTAPFMGSALGFAMTQPSHVALMVFAVLGFGMATPYMILSAMPGLLRFVPRPGPWMITFKNIMGFLLLWTVVWLAGILGLQQGTKALTVFLAALLLLGTAAWVLGRWTGPTRTGVARSLAWIISAALVLLALGLCWRVIVPRGQGGVSQREAGTLKWEDYSPERLQELRQEGRNILIDFTAAWCLTCQVNELTVFGNPKVIAKFQEKNVALLKADWTSQDETVTRALAGYGRNAVPLYVFYGPDPMAPPTILPEIITPGIVLKKLE